MKTPLLIYFLFLSIVSYSQSLEQAIIGAAGNFSTTSGGSTLSWTIGEPTSSTESSNSAILTQGFQQPVSVNPMPINKHFKEAVSIQVFPNPTAQKITIQVNKTINLKADLINILGQTIDSYLINKATSSIDLEALPAANYLLQIYNPETSSIKTFKIQKIQ